MTIFPLPVTGLAASEKLLLTAVYSVPAAGVTLAVALRRATTIRRLPVPAVHERLMLPELRAVSVTAEAGEGATGRAPASGRKQGRRPTSRQHILKEKRRINDVLNGSAASQEIGGDSNYFIPHV
ncbi:hypothetical protein GCM10028786_21710 [Flaviaesturariibacter terrae]